MANPSIYNALVAKTKYLQDEEDNACQYELRRELSRRSELDAYNERRAGEIQTQQREDLILHNTFEAEKEMLRLTESQNQRLRNERMMDLRNLGEIEAKKSRDDLQDTLRIVNNQSQIRQHLRFKEIDMQAVARRDRIHDYQEEAEQNSIRERKQLAALEKFAITSSQAYQDMRDADIRKTDKQIDYMHERKNIQQQTRNFDKKYIEYLDHWQSKGPNRSYNYQFTPIE